MGLGFGGMLVSLRHIQPLEPGFFGRVDMGERTKYLVVMGYTEEKWIKKRSVAK